MSIYFNLNDKFNNSLILYFDSKIKASKTDYYENFVVFKDENNNVKSVNVLEYKEIQKLNNYGLMPEKLNNEIKQELIKINSNYKFSEPEYFTIGKIIKREVHPKSEKLFVLQVFFGSEIKQIITNTLYTLEGKYFVWCLPGSITAKGLEIKEGEVLGVKSLGMLCSAESLNLNETQSKELDNFLTKCTDKDLGKSVFAILK